MTKRRFAPPPFPPTLQPNPFRDPDQENRFLALVRAELGKHGTEVTIADGVARVSGSDIVHGLTNLAQSCNLSAESEWPTIVREHFAKSDPMRVRESAVRLVEGGLERNVDSLAVRIYADDHFQGPLAGYFVERVDLPATRTVLALDVGSSVIPVPSAVAETWGVPHAVLFDRAMDNLVRLSRARWSTMSIPPVGDFGFDLLHGDFHAPTHLLRRDPGLPRIGKHGNLIGIPACGVLFSYPVDAALDALTIESLLAISLGKCHDGPNAITPHLYWRTTTGTCYLQRALRLGRGTRFLPSPEFVECMVQLQKRRSNEAGT